MSRGDARDDMAIPASIPDRVVTAALGALRADPALSAVTWEVPRRKGNRPTKVHFSAPDITDLRRAKDTLETLLADAGWRLY